VEKNNKRHPSKIIVTLTINIRNTFDTIIIESKRVALIIAARGLFTAKCCSLGMDPIIFSSWEEQQCVTNFTNRKIKMPQFDFLYLFHLKKTWKGNLNYWTGGKQGCKGQWYWCSGSDSKPFTSNLSWAPNQPEFAKKKENCLHMRVPQNGSGILLSAKYVYQLKYIFKSEINCCRENRPFHLSYLHI